MHRESPVVVIFDFGIMAQSALIHSRLSFSANRFSPRETDELPWADSEFTTNCLTVLFWRERESIGPQPGSADM